MGKKGIKDGEKKKLGMAANPGNWRAVKGKGACRMWSPKRKGWNCAGGPWTFIPEIN